MAAALNENVIKNLRAPESGNRIFFFKGAKIQGTMVPRGFGVRMTAAGSRSFVLDYRLGSRQRRFTIGAWPDWSALRAVQEARELRRRIDRGDDPFAAREALAAVPAAVKTVNNVLDQFVARVLRNSERPMRSADTYEKAFDRVVRPTIGDVGIYNLRRSHVAEMLDTIEDQRGPVMADRARSYLRRALGWYAERDDQFNLNQSIVRVTARANERDRARSRILNDDELRVLWPALGEAGAFGSVSKLLLLTASRRSEIARLRWSEVGQDGIEIPAMRYKTKRPHFIPLSTAARAIIEVQPSNCEFVFPASRFGDRPISDLAGRKADLDRIAPLPGWRLHDLRRTARSLMSRAGVNSDIAERVLGHALRGVEGVYDRHSYFVEKADALEKLACLITTIVGSDEKRHAE
jgi:integrase